MICITGVTLLFNKPNRILENIITTFVLLVSDYEDAIVGEYNIEVPYVLCQARPAYKHVLFVFEAVRFTHAVYTIQRVFILITIITFTSQ
jgi:hypothetical protein